MAIFHFHTRIVKRSKGQSAVAKAAYNSRERLLNENTKESHDYRYRGTSLFSYIILPADSPE
jgi:hypothetical protein